jgi:hypothetical protein
MSIKKALIVLLFILPYSPLSAQKFDVRFQASPNITFMPNFANQVIIINDGLLVPGLISPSNSITIPLLSSSTSQTSPGIGFGANVEIRYDLGKAWKISLGCGIDLMRYDFDTYIKAAGTPNLWLSEYTPDYGNTGIYYMNIKPLNISKGILNGSLNFQAGATINITLKSDYFNTLIVFCPDPPSCGQVDGIDRVYFDSFGEANKFLIGLHGRVEFHIINTLDIFASCMHFFNSVYNKDTSSEETVKQAKPTQLEIGFSYVFWKFKKP